jgi:anthranilate synthase
MAANSRPERRIEHYRTRGGIDVIRTSETVDRGDTAERLIRSLDRRRGCFFSSSVEFPGRYSRWDVGFAQPPLAVAARGRDFRIEALNGRGRILLTPLAQALRPHAALERFEATEERLSGRISPSRDRFPEELRSKQPSLFTVIRLIVDAFASDEDHHLGLYGAFGYDLAFQFEPIRLRLERPENQRDLVLYLPDEILTVDHQQHLSMLHRYEFMVGGASTKDHPRDGRDHPYRPEATRAPADDHAKGEYPAVVRRARESFARGDLFEVVPGQTFSEVCATQPSQVFETLRRINPAPYGALMNLGDGEFLVSASPEMYVRVDGRRIETCPISGTIARGRDAIGDAAQVLRLLNSEKDASELTMCTDVDRNDKARVCEPGTVRVIGRRQIEMYSRLIHTVDHVEGMLRNGYDALDGFLSHAWAVTVTGAPKRWAIQFIEDHEKSSRRWYGGAIGWVGFDGCLNTGLTLRTVRMADGIAEVRAGATLLFDSDPDAEDEECRLKASALLAAIRSAGRPPPAAVSAALADKPGIGRRVLLVDHEDSFVHMLADYFRQTGAEVSTLRYNLAVDALRQAPPDLAVLSPGPGRPADFDVSGTLAAAIAAQIPVFGVCLGLQGIAEYFGGRLGTLGYPQHGKAATVAMRPSRFLKDLPKSFSVGRYHSLFAEPEGLPPELSVVGVTDDGVIMALEHRTLPILAVQFHPESILSLENEVGHRLVRQVVAALCRTVPASPRPGPAPVAAR